jgi:hypothetical protein
MPSTIRLHRVLKAKPEEGAEATARTQAEAGARTAAHLRMIGRSPMGTRNSRFLFV